MIRVKCVCVCVCVCVYTEADVTRALQLTADSHTLLTHMHTTHQWMNESLRNVTDETHRLLCAQMERHTHTHTHTHRDTHTHTHTHRHTETHTHRERDT